MIVRLKKNSNSHQNWLNQNKNYVVLGIDFRLDYQETYVNIKTEDCNTPALFNLDEFDIITTSINGEWVFERYLPNILSLHPKEFSGDFWDNFHNASLATEDVFWQVYNQLAIELNELEEKSILL